MRVEADARSERRPKAFDHSRRRREAARWILRVEPDLDRVPTPRRAAGFVQLLAGRDLQLFPHDVDPGHQLTDGMLDLQARIQLDEVVRAVWREQELEGAGVQVRDRTAGPRHRGLHRLARRVVERR